MTRIDVRKAAPGDMGEIEALYPSAFPDEDLLPLVKALLCAGEAVLSLTGVLGAGLAGHALFTRCEISGCDASAALLGPLAVKPEQQRMGVGVAMIQEGFKQLTQDGTDYVFVLGDPAYYARFGFLPECGVTPPYPLPDEWRTAWQAVGLNDAKPLCRGVLVVPLPWRQAALWAP